MRKWPIYVAAGILGITLTSLASGTPEAGATSKSERFGYQWHELYAPANMPNWILVIVAGWAGFSALKTLGAIRRQAELMQTQNEMVISKERARLRLEFSQDISEPSGEVGQYEVVATISIFGVTNAFSDRTEFQAIVGEFMGPSLKPDGWKGVMKIPSVICPTQTPIQVRASIENGTGYLDNEEFSKILKRSESFIFAIGAIYYTDAFERRRVVRFNKRWSYLRIPIEGGGWGGRVGYWQDMGSSEANGEFDVSEANKEKLAG